jgi:predicted nuclease of predicted toxin-antitoxin system
LSDNQLPAALAQHLRKRGVDCQHVADVGLDRATDREICDYADEHGLVIVSKDQDFLYLANRPKPRITLIWVRLGNCRTSLLLQAFDRIWSEIESALNAGDQIIEIR